MQNFENWFVSVNQNTGGNFLKFISVLKNSFCLLCGCLAVIELLFCLLLLHSLSLYE